MRRSRTRAKPKTEPRARANEQIRVQSVRLIDADGQQVGVVSIQEALQRARQAGLDLVEVSRGTMPPVCKILDHGRYQYEQTKRRRESLKHQQKIEIKGVRLGFRTNEHDLALRRKQAEEFLAEHHKIRVEIVLRGREKAHRELATQNLTAFVASLGIPTQVEESLAISPRGLAITLSPKREAKETPTREKAGDDRQ